MILYPSDSMLPYRKRRLRIVLPLIIVFVLRQIFGIQSAATMMMMIESKGNKVNLFPLSIRLKGRRECEEEDDKFRQDDCAVTTSDRSLVRHRQGQGRECFDTPRGGADFYDQIGTYDDNDDDSSADDEEQNFFKRMESYRERRRSSPSSSIHTDNDGTDGYYFSRGGRPPLYSSAASPPRRQQQSGYKMIRSVQNWFMEKVDPKIPKVVCVVEPSMTLKLRKTFRPLKTIIRLGADYNTQQGVWQFKSSWEDAIIGGKLTLSGNRELQLTKSWQLSVGAVEDLVTRLRFRAAINLQTFQGNIRVGFRTERLTPIDVVEGFSILKRLPLDGKRGNLKLEVKACVSLPEPEIEYSTETQRSLIGMGNIEVSIGEMNLLLDY